MSEIENLNNTIKDLEAQLRDLASKLEDCGWEWCDVKEYITSIYQSVSWLEEE